MHLELSVSHALFHDISILPIQINIEKEGSYPFPLKMSGSYPFPLEMSEALLEKPSPGWIPLEFGTDTLRTNGVRSGSGTCLPLAGSFLSNTTVSLDEMLDLSDFQDLYRKYISFIGIFDCLGQESSSLETKSELGNI